MPAGFTYRVGVQCRSITGVHTDLAAIPSLPVLSCLKVPPHAFLRWCLSAPSRSALSACPAGGVPLGRHLCLRVAVLAACILRLRARQAVHLQRCACRTLKTRAPVL